MRQDRALTRASERIGDGGALLVGKAVGGGGVSGVGGPIIARPHEVDRRQDHQYRPKQREPAAGEEGAEAGRGEHGADIQLVIGQINNTPQPGNSMGRAKHMLCPTHF